MSESIIPESVVAQWRKDAHEQSARIEASFGRVDGDLARLVKLAESHEALRKRLSSLEHQVQNFNPSVAREFLGRCACALSPKAADLPDACYLNHECLDDDPVEAEHPYYCPKCLPEALAEAKSRNPEFADDISCGYENGVDLDTTPVCAKCGEDLHCTLTQYGAEMELIHFLSIDRSEEWAKSPEGIEELRRVAEGLSGESVSDVIEFLAIALPSLRYCWETLRAERDALAAKLAEAEKDAPRLNHVNAVLERLTSPGLYQEWLGPHPDTPDGVRAAIDDAIKRAKESENDRQ